jgi:hypothetical protein
MSPEYRGIFQLMKKETQPAITREDWNSGCRRRFTKMGQFAVIRCLTDRRMRCRISNHVRSDRLFRPYTGLSS